MDNEAATSKRPPSGVRAEQKRAAIVAAARETFLQEGFAAGVDLIAARAGVSKVTIYNHFGSKEALFTAVIADALDAPVGGTLVAAVDQLAEADDLRMALIEAAHAWVASVRENPDVLAIRNLVARELHRFPDLGRAWQHQPPDTTTRPWRAHWNSSWPRAASPSRTWKWRSSSSTHCCSIRTWSSARTAPNSTPTSPTG